MREILGRLIAADGFIRSAMIVVGRRLAGTQMLSDCLDMFKLDLHGSLSIGNKCQFDQMFPGVDPLRDQGQELGTSGGVVIGMSITKQLVVKFCPALWLRR